MFRRVAAATLCAMLGLSGCASVNAPRNPDTVESAATTAAVVSGAFVTVAEDERPLLPDWTGKTLEGERWTTADLVGSPAVVNFWASWCSPCAEEWPALQAAAAAHPDVQFVGINTWDELPAARAFAATSPAGYPLVSDIDGAFIAALEGMPNDSLPMTLVVDAAGRIAAWRTGIIDEAALQRAIKAL